MTSARRQLHSVQGILYLLLLVVIVPSLVLWLVESYRAFQDARAQTIAANMEVARTAAMAIESYLEQNVRTLHALGDTLVRLPGATREEIDRQLGQSAGENPTWRSLALVSPRGRVMASSVPEEVGRMADGAQMLDTIANRRATWAVSDVQRDAVTDEPIFHLARGVYDARDTLYGILIATIAADRLDYVLRVQRSGGASLLVIDARGWLVYRTPALTMPWSARNLRRTGPFVGRALRGQEATGVGIGLDGVRRVFALAPVPLSGWVAGASMPEDVVLGPLRRQFLREVIVYLLLFPAVFLIGLLVSRAITRPLHALMRHTRQVAEGALDAHSVVTGPVEVAELAAAFNVMTDRLRERTTQLEQARAQAAASAEFQRVLVETVPAGIMQCDRHGTIVEMNPMAEEMLLPDACGKNVFGPPEGFGFFHADGTPFPMREMPLPRALTEGQVTRDLEFRITLPDGVERMVLSSTAPLRDAAGEIVGAVTVFQDVSPLHQLQEERELYIHTISHDLRTPLTVMQGHVQMLKDLIEEAGLRADTSLDAIAHAVIRMNVMIQDLVDSARIAGHTLELKRESIDLRHYLADLLPRTGAGMEVSRVHLDLPASLPPVFADPNRLERILINLLSNALKYSPAETPVTVSARARDSEVVISVRDQGAGIAPEDLPNLFTRFYRARGTHKTEGIGLGLYITRMLVEAHGVPAEDGKTTVGGRIWVESTPGQGSTFCFTLPTA